MKRIVCFFGRERQPRLYNYHLHLGFFEKAFRWHGYELVHHGPVPRGVKDGPLLFEQHADSLARCIAEVKPVALMVFENKLADWAIGQAPSSLPKFVYAVDLHRTPEPRCYKGADAVLVRAKRFETFFQRRPRTFRVGACKWFPFSVDTDLVARVSKTPRTRLHRVIFCGSLRTEPYPLRHKVVSALEEAGLLSPLSRASNQLKLADYYARLDASLVGLATTGRLRLNMAKHVEIPAAGACLMTTGGPGMEEMLPRGLYVRFSGERDAVDKARFLCTTTEGLVRAAAIGERARAHVFRHHSDRVRAREIVSFLRKTLSI